MAVKLGAVGRLKLTGLGNLCTRSLNSAKCSSRARSASSSTSTRFRLSSITFHEASTCLERLAEIQDILTDELSREPVNECLGFSKNELKQRYSKRFLEDKLQEGLSMVAKHENRVVGFALGYVHSLEKYGAGHLSAKGEPLQAIRTIFLEKMRELMPNERCIFFNHMVILKSYEGYGLGELLTKEWLGLIGRKGFKVVFGIAVTKLVKVKLQVVSEVHKTINYKDFELNGQKPFETLAEQHEGATLLVIRL